MQTVLGVRKTPNSKKLHVASIVHATLFLAIYHHSALTQPGTQDSVSAFVGRTLSKESLHAFPASRQSDTKWDRERTCTETAVSHQDFVPHSKQLHVLQKSNRHDLWSRVSADGCWRRNGLYHSFFSRRVENGPWRGFSAQDGFSSPLSFDRRWVWNTDQLVPHWGQ